MVVNISPNNGGCWFCHTQDDDLVFDWEFDTFVHENCIKSALNRLNQDPIIQDEAIFMAYLLTEGTAHELKTWTIYFDLIWKRIKDFEIRLNDRDYKVGDILVLKDFDPVANDYTMRTLIKKVKYVLNDSLFCKEGYVVMGLEDINV